MSQYKDVSAGSAGRSCGESATVCSEGESAIPGDYLYASDIVDSTGENPILSKEQRRLFRWLDTFGNRWLGVANKMMVKQWLLQKKSELPIVSEVGGRPVTNYSQL